MPIAMFEDFSILPPVESPLGSYWLVIVIDPNLCEDLGVFVRTMWETENLKSCLVSAWLGRPKGAQKIQYVTLSDWIQELLPLPPHQSTHFSRQYKCKSYNLLGLCGLWLIAAECLYKMMLWKVTGSLSPADCQDLNSMHEGMSWLMYTLWRATIILGLFKTQSWDCCLKERLDALPNLNPYDLLTPPLDAFEKKGTFPSCWVSLFTLLIFNSVVGLGHVFKNNPNQGLRIQVAESVGGTILQWAHVCV